MDASGGMAARIMYITLLSIAAALTALLLMGTIFGLIRSREAVPLVILGNPGYSQTAHASDDIRVFSGLGRLRIPLANSSTMLLSIAFPYSANDTAFTEELAARIGDFRAMASDYFSSLDAQSVIQIDEDAAKLEILKRFNNSLRLGRIQALYFNDMLVIDAAN